MIHMGNAELEILFQGKGDIGPMAADAWSHMGAKPFQDPAFDGEKKKQAKGA